MALQRSGIDYTIIRPGGLVDEAKNGRGEGQVGCPTPLLWCSLLVSLRRGRAGQHARMQRAPACIGAAPLEDRPSHVP